MSRDGRLTLVRLRTRLLMTDRPEDRDRLIEVARDVKHMSKALDGVMLELQKQREANDEWRRTHERATQEKLDDHRRAIDEKLLSKADSKDLSFLQNIVYGACGLILVAVLGAWISGVLVKPVGEKGVPAAYVETVQ